VAALVAALAAALAVTATARAQEPPADEPGVAQEAARVDSFAWRRFELRGRALGDVYRETAGGETRSDVDADSLRLELRWRPARWLRAVVEADAAEEPHLKDAYVALRGGRSELRAGQFKPPISPVQMASRWELPSVDRGLLDDVLVEAFGIAGRRPGLQAQWNQKKGPLVAMAGVFRASNVRGDRIGDESFDNLAKDWGAVKATGRLAYAKKRLELGASFDLRPAEPVPGEDRRHLWTGSFDLTWSRKGRGPRAWAEAYAGRSWQDADAFDGRDATFLAGRTIAGWRFGDEDAKAGRARISAEPYFSGSLFDPDASIRDDLAWEVAGGVHLRALGHLRLTLEAGRRTGSRNTPLSLGLFAAGTRPDAPRTRLAAQLGAAF
jgi:hypothetical protein